MTKELPALMVAMAIALFVASSPFQASSEPPKELGSQISPSQDCTYLGAAEGGPSAWSSVEWTGLCLDGLVNGPGTLTLHKGEYYFRLEGVFDKGAISGEGALTFYGRKGMFANHATEMLEESEAGSLSYRGAFQNNAPHGHGVMTIDDKIILTGTFEQGHFIGYGKMEAVGILTVIGVFDGPMAYGRGEIQYRYGGRYEGDIVGYKENGHGVYVTSYGDRYEGIFRDGVLSGKGRVTYADGARYEGGVDGSVGLYREGHGTLIETNGNRCEGEWKDDRLIGQGRGTVDGRGVICTEDDSGIHFLN